MIKTWGIRFVESRYKIFLLLIFYSFTAFGETLPPSTLVKALPLDYHARTQPIDSFSNEDYAKRFTMFQNWFQQLPLNPDQQFLTFIDEQKPLSNALRDKWLYELARTQDWKNYRNHYVASSDPNLQCFALLAEYQAGNQAQALTRAAALWLSPTTLPKSCDPIFEQLKKNSLYNDNLITARIALALSHQNLPLARYLLKQFKPAKQQEEQLLLSIHQSPQKITSLSLGSLHELFYLYGLKRILSANLNRAIYIWSHPKTKQILRTPLQQDFLIQLAILKASKHDPDASRWFALIKPTYYHERLLEWQIRDALQHKNYTKVLHLINLTDNKNSPDWQYWCARALEAQGHQTKANELYKKLAQKRHYYGFMASVHLKQNPQFEHEFSQSNIALLKSFQPVLNDIATLYKTGQKRQASQLIHHFASELPKNQQSALAWWVQSELHWHAKSVQLSNHERLQNQLTLRFPLIYQKTVAIQAQSRQLPPELIYAIIRQESIYSEDVISSAGALGLMQILPSTAKLMSRAFKIHFKDNKELFEQDKNITLGSAYLSDLSRRFNHHPILMAAAYNAGPGKVKRWMKDFEGHDIDRFIETIPWQETRNYLKNVFAYYVVYQYRLQKKLDLRPVMAGINNS